MSRQTRTYIALTLSVAMFASGCKPIQPFYLGEKDDLAHYMQVATNLEYPDVHEASLAETVLAQPPLTLSNPEPRELWDLSLEEAIQISLHNSKVLKRIGGARAPIGSVNPSVNVSPPSSQLRDRVLSPDSVDTIYGPALQESNIGSTLTQGVEGALSAFDAQFSTSLFWNRTDRPENAIDFGGADIFPSLRNEDQMTFQAEIAKQNAAGTQMFFRNNTIYTEPTMPPSRQRPKDWFTNLEAEVRQPLWRGRGTQVNRVPVVLARIRTDVSLADFECAVRDHILDVENTYWETYFAYRNLEAAKTRRDSVHHIWRVVKSRERAGVEGGAAQDEALARQEYYLARANVEGALVDLFQIENRLRFLMGLSPTDGRLIRPIDEPLNTSVAFDWHQILNESLCRSCELRVKRWQIKQREMDLVAARNNLLPQFDAVALYRWLGRGEHLLNDEDSPQFPAPASDAFEQLFGGNFQEWQLGFEMTLPVGFRRELAGVRHAQLQLARERAILQETELEVAHVLTDAVQRVDALFHLTETNFNRRVATEREVEAKQAAVVAGTEPVEFVLNAVNRNADAQISFYRTLVHHTQIVAEVHSIKGSLLEYNNVLLAEGAWPGKAYFDAHHLARQRAAGTYMDYGYTRPRVISRGSYEQFQGGAPVGVGVEIHAAQGAVDDVETIETPAPTPAEQGAVMPRRPSPAAQIAVASQTVTTASAASPTTKGDSTSAAGSVEITVRKGAKFDWGEMGGLNTPAE